MKFLIKLFLTAIAVAITAFVLEPHVQVEGFWSAIIVAAVLSLLNVTVRPLLIILTIPATVLTLGLFLLVINAVVILIADYFVSDFYVDGFWWALLASLILSVIGSIFNKMLGEEEPAR